MHISVIGTGYVGLVTGACFAEFGVNVTCMDTDARRIARLEKGEVPFFEPGITELVAKGIKEDRLQFHHRRRQSRRQSAGHLHRRRNSSQIGRVRRSLLRRGSRPRHRQKHDWLQSHCHQVDRPGRNGEKLREVIKANQTGRFRFDIVSNPEFLREGSAIEDFMRPNRVVIGADSEQAVAIMKDLYRPLYLLETPVVVTDIPTAEMIKYASNAFLAVKISFINEIATVCEKVGADVQMVSKGMGLDHRIGNKFLHAGPGFGGSCFPKDLAALVQTGERVGYPFQIAGAAAKVNYEQHMRMVAKVKEACGGVKGKTLGVLGLSFKPNTNDMREAPSLTILERVNEGRGDDSRL